MRPRPQPRNALTLLFLASTLVASADLNWPEPTAENRPATRWWWLGNAVDEQNLTANLELLHNAGIGGVEVASIYGVKGGEADYIQHLSPEFFSMIAYTARETKRLGMFMDLTGGSGWPFGGPMITDEHADTRLQVIDGEASIDTRVRDVKRAAPGGEGNAVNPFSATAMRHYLESFDALFSGENATRPRAIFHDSFEYEGNWTSKFPGEFERRRGYPITPHLETIFSADDSERAVRLRADYRETISDLHLDFIAAWTDWAHANGSTTRNQAHGAPGNLLDIYAASDIPETEIFGAATFNIPGIRREADNVPPRDSPNPLIMRMASSAAHVTGKPLVGSETATWVRNHFRAALSQIKPEIDQLFLNGINHIFFHGTTYSPEEAPWPGWLFYASVQYNPRNAIWRDAPLLNAYITRAQSILQSGQPDNDVALYWPVSDVWHDPANNPRRTSQMLTVHHPEWITESACGETAGQLRAEGFGFDFISDRQLLVGLSKGYRAVVVPRTRHMPLPTLEKLLELAAAGQHVIFLDELPDDVPGYHQFEARRATLRSMLKKHAPPVVDRSELAGALTESGVLREPMVDHGLEFIRRTHDSGHHYFIANMGAVAVDTWVPLGVPFQSAVIMDPRSGETGVAPQQGNALFLQLKPGESRILRTFSTRQVAGEAWPVYEPVGEPRVVTGEWTITFIEGGPTLPSPIVTDALRCWTAIGDAEAQRFAGTARYVTYVDVPAGIEDWEIDLGDVRESARVFLNGKEVAGLFSVPFSAPLRGHLKPGRNRLEIEVTNLSANRIRDLDIRGVEWKIFGDINIVNHRYRRFDASGWDLSPSGLLGPVNLIPLANK